MSQIRTALFRVLVAWSVVAPVHALAVVRNDDTVGDPGSFPFAIEMGDASEFFCSGTVIGGGKYVITAEHCLIDGTDAGAYRFMSDDGTMVSGIGTVAVHPDFDLAIIPLAGAFTDSVSIYSSFDELGRRIDFAGFGKSSSDATGGGPGTGQQELPLGTPRSGANVIDYINEASNLVLFDFDLAGGVGTGGLGDAEATTFIGDSGMGYVTEVSPGAFELLGVHSGVYVPPPVNTDQVFSFGVRLSTVRGWIDENIPSPAPISLGALAMVCGSRRRRAAQICAGTARNHRSH